MVPKWDLLDNIGILGTTFMTSDVYCRVFIDNGPDMLEKEKYEQMTLAKKRQGIKVTFAKTDK